MHKTNLTLNEINPAYNNLTIHLTHLELTSGGLASMKWAQEMRFGKQRSGSVPYKCSGPGGVPEVNVPPFYSLYTRFPTASPQTKHVLVRL